MILRATSFLHNMYKDNDHKAFYTFAETAHRFIEQWDKNFSALLDTSSQGAIVSPDASVHPTAILGNDVIICDGARIGPYCYLKSKVIIGPHAQLGYGVEADRLILMKRSKIGHSACTGRSIIGPDCNLGYSFVNTTRHLKGRPIQVWIAGKKMWESEASHHGAVLGAHVQAAVHAATRPGATVEPGEVLLPGWHLPSAAP